MLETEWNWTTNQQAPQIQITRLSNKYVHHNAIYTVEPRYKEVGYNKTLL